MGSHIISAQQLLESDIIAFLKNAYFGSTEDPVLTAAQSAYLDLNRTIEFNCVEAITNETKSGLRAAATQLIEKGVRSLLARQDLDAASFDLWHNRLCEQIIELYRGRDVPFHYGQAQKWINMTMKYFCVLDRKEANRIISLMHLPIDSIVFERANDFLSVPYPRFRWSRMTGDQYKGYLSNIREALSRKESSCPPMIWEFRYWER